MRYNSLTVKLATLLVIFLSGCRQHDEMLRINMSIKNNPQNQIVSLIGKAFGSSPAILDTALITAGNTHCSFEILNTQQGIYSIRFEKENRFILFTNDKPEIDIALNWNDFSTYTITSSGSASLKNMLSGFNRYQSAVDSTQSIVSEPVLQNETDSTKEIVKQSASAKIQQAQQYLLHYADSAASPAVALYALGILEQQQADSSLLKPLVSGLSKRFPDNEDVRKISTAYFALLVKQGTELSVGKQSPLFSLPDTSGQPVTLQSFHGKFTLVDFWASWCGPCRKENPTVVAAYEAYKNKNFTVLGVSLDKDKAAWLEAIHKDGLLWQHVSDLREWNSAVVSLYQIQGIPFNVLLDPAGKIIAMNLRGNTLQHKLGELLK